MQVLRLFPAGKLTDSNQPQLHNSNRYWASDRCFCFSHSAQLHIHKGSYMPLKPLRAKAYASGSWPHPRNPQHPQTVVRIPDS